MVKSRDEMLIFIKTLLATQKAEVEREIIIDIHKNVKSDDFEWHGLEGYAQSKGITLSAQEEEK